MSKKLLERIGKAIAGLIAVATLWSLRQSVLAGWKFLKPLSGNGDAFLGSALIILFVLSLIALAGWLCFHFITLTSLPLNVHLVLNKVLKKFRAHFAKVVTPSPRPSLFRFAARRRWNGIIEVVLEGLSDDKVMNMYCQDGNPIYPLFFCNFQSYANVVARILQHITTNCSQYHSSSLPQVWTLFKRPVPNWYNTFPVQLQNDEGIEIRGQVTFDWWEKYKNTVASLKGRDSRFQMRRIVGEVERKQSLAELQGYYLYDKEPLKIKAAIEKMNTLKGAVQWHPSISQLLNKENGMKSRDEILIYLIGKQKDGNPSDVETVPLLDHFQNTYHNGGEPGTNEQGGVFLRYAPANWIRASHLKKYNDIFIVKFSSSEGFGLIFIDDDIRDISGLRVIPEDQVRQRQDASYVETPYDLFVSMWNKLGDR